MNEENPSAAAQVDPAAVFACASSLLEACHEYTKYSRLNLSDCYNGIDHLMRLAMRIGDQFETWSCTNINFNELSDVWPYLLEDKFGETCLKIMPITHLESFDDSDCLLVARAMELPMKHDYML